MTGVMSGCAAVPSSSCQPPLQPRQVADLLFGRSVHGGHEVSEAQWRSFLDAEITPRFPDGLTVGDASGQWRGARGILRERTKRVTIALPGLDTDEARIAAIVAAYKSRFRQESVGVIVTPACVSF